MACIDSPVSDCASTHGSEGGALSRLRQSNLAASAITSIASDEILSQSRKVRIAILMHGNTPRFVWRPIVGHLQTMELVAVALSSTVSAEVQRSCEDAVLSRIKAIALGERKAMARRCTKRILQALILDADMSVVRLALHNGRLSEAGVIKAILSAKAPVGLIEAVCGHPVWSVRREVRLAALRSENIPLGAALTFASGLPKNELNDILHRSSLPQNIKTALFGQRRP